MLSIKEIMARASQKFDRMSTNEQRQLLTRVGLLKVGKSAPSADRVTDSRATTSRGSNAANKKVRSTRR